MTSEERSERPGPSESSESYFIPAGSGSRHLIFPGVEIRTTAGTNLMLSVVRLEPESVVLEHSHPHEQMGYLLEGRLEFTVGGVDHLNCSRISGDVLARIPGGVVHRVRALDQPAVALDVFHPIREDYL